MMEYFNWIEEDADGRDVYVEVHRGPADEIKALEIELRRRSGYNWLYREPAKYNPARNYCLVKRYMPEKVMSFDDFGPICTIERADNWLLEECISDVEEEGG